MDTTGLTVVREGMRVVGVPVGTEQFQRDFLQEAREGASPDGGCPSELSDFASICYFSPLTFASNSSALHHVPSGSKLRRFGVVDVSVYHSWRQSCRGRATNARGSSPRSHCVPKLDLPGARWPTAGPPANPRRRPWTYQQQLHQKRGIYRLPRPGPGACRRCLRPGEPSIPS